MGCAPSECSLTPGTYSVTMIEVSGNCGPLSPPDVVLDAVGGPPFTGADTSCTGAVDLTDDMCSVEYDRTCDILDADGSYLGSLRFRGANTIVSATRVEGRYVMTSDGPGSDIDCTSTYDITFSLVR